MPVYPLRASAKYLFVWHPVYRKNGLSDLLSQINVVHVSTYDDNEVLSEEICNSTNLSDPTSFTVYILRVSGGRVQ